MHVHHTVQIGTSVVDRAVDDEASAADPVFAGDQVVPVPVDLQQIRRADLVVAHAVGIDQQIALGTGQAHRDEVVDQKIPMEVMHQPECSGELNPEVPLGVVDGIAIELR
jgi:hypothetical protein